MYHKCHRWVSFRELADDRGWIRDTGEMRRSLAMFAAICVLVFGWTAPAHAVTYTTSRCGNTSSRILITFDDWAYDDPYRATRTGAYLKSRDIRAAFFLEGDEAEDYPDIVATLRQQGHWVLNHTYSHPHLTQLSDAAIRTEISKGVTSNRLRPPYGDWDDRVASIASSLGYRICWGTINTKDWQYIDGKLRSVGSIRSRVRNAPASAKYGGVIIGHLWSNYPDALPGIISDMKAEGRLFCRINGSVGRNMGFPASCNP